MGGLRPALSNHGDHADHPREHRDVRQPQWRRPAGLRGGRAHHRDAANGHREGVRAQRRHVQRERPAILGWQLDREQSSGPADPDRHRGAGRRSTLGAVVSAEIRRQVRHQGRRAEPRRGIHHRPKRKLPLRQRGVRLAGIANNRFTRRRPRLPARGPGRPRTRAGDGQHHRAGRRLQREPDPTRFAQRGGEQPQWRELPDRHRDFGDRGAAICVWRGRVRKAERRRSAAGRLQTRGLVRQLQIRRPAIRYDGRAARQSLEQRDAGSASRRLFTVRCHGPDDLAFERQRQSQPECLLPSNVHALRGSQSRQRQHQRGLRLARSIAGARQRRLRGRNGNRLGEQRRIRLRPANAILPALGLYAHSLERDLSRGDLSVSGSAFMADSARRPVFHQSRPWESPTRTIRRSGSRTNWWSACARTSRSEASRLRQGGGGESCGL